MASHYIITAWYTMITFDDIMSILMGVYYGGILRTQDHTTRRLGSHYEETRITL